MRTNWRLTLLLVLLTVTPAQADTIYSYVGDHFTAVTGAYTTADRIVGSLRVADGFTPVLTAAGPDFTSGLLGWSFTDGHMQWTDATTAAFFTYGEGSTGLGWHVGLVTSDRQNQLYIEVFADRLDEVRTPLGTGWLGQTIGAPDGSRRGTWTITVPEPATGLLALLGVALVAWRARCTRS